MGKKVIINFIKLLVISVLIFLLQQNGFIDFEGGDFYKNIGNQKKSTDLDQQNKSVFFSSQKDGKKWLQSLETITGNLIISPDVNGWNLWKKNIKSALFPIKKDKNYFHGRLYQLTFKEAKSFLKDLGIGNEVKIILENQKFSQYKNDFKDLQNYFGKSVELKNDFKLGVNYTHAKTFFSENFVIIETANLSYTSFFKNIEHFFYTKNKKVQKNIKKLREKDRNGQKILPKDISPEILFCPIDCREKIEFILNNSKKSIFSFQQYITDKSIKNIIEKKITDGIDVKIKIPNKAGNQILQKELGKKSVFLFGNPYIHSKTILVDDKYLILGSMNMSSNSLDKNREIGIIIKDKKIINQRKKDFNNW